MGKTYQITEYGSFTRGKERSGCTALPARTFDALENLILSNSGEGTEALELMGLTARKGIGKIITARNYVGVIAMEDGTTIEILPKVYSAQGESEEKVKGLLVRMLQSLKNAPYKRMQMTNIDVKKMNVLEIFIRMFVDEVFRIVKHGLKSNYETVRSNGNVFKGKPVFEEHVKRNYTRRDRCFMEYDEFNANRVENRLIKATLLYLYRSTSSGRNRNDIRTLLESFADVDESRNYAGDFSKIRIDRNMKDYETALDWCRVFLTGKSFTSYQGSEVAFALLFPMETLFESYIAAQLRRVLPRDEYSITVQDRRHHLFDEPRKRFRMRPDIVIRNRKTGQVRVMDTKWKVLSETKPDFGISQADMYQMYAYQKKYDAEDVTLLYPFTDKVRTTGGSHDREIEYNSHDGARVRVEFVDLFNVKESLRDTLGEAERSV